MKKLLLSTVRAPLMAQPLLAQIVRIGPMAPSELGSASSGDVSNMSVRANNIAAGRSHLGAVVGDVFNVKNGSATLAGAAGDGVADDTAAIQAVETAACNAVSNNQSDDSALLAYVGVY